MVVGAIGAGAFTGTLLCATAGTAAADPPPRPPDCTAADVAGVAAGVATALSNYLSFTQTSTVSTPAFKIGPKIKSRMTCRTSLTPTRKSKPTLKASVSR